MTLALQNIICEVGFANVIQVHFYKGFFFELVKTKKNFQQLGR